MILFKRAGDLHKYIEEQQRNDLKIGFVPTMGALHPGHLSLIERSLSGNDRTVCSIFVNPTQFNDPEDLRKYPVTIEKDIFELERSGCDVLFLPPVQEIYPEGTDKRLNFDLGYLETVLEGKFRPGHFQGVCMVMDRLLKIVSPDNLYLGQKDYQQCMVIKRLINLSGMDKTIHLNICPTFRESDGLAMSSRNLRLNEEAREKATIMYRSLLFIKSSMYNMSVNNVKAEAERMLTNAGFRVDYVEIAGADTLNLIDSWNGDKKIVALIAAFINNVRLIDNMIIN
ncbi:MAG: pantoate--beta-alanine ligase [Chitinophagales bacterium]|nr:pantoate--beta-alanine ligase [Chitinophagales bacterium]